MVPSLPGILAEKKKEKKKTVEETGVFLGWKIP